MANENVITTTALVGLSGQLDTVRTEITATNLGLQNVASLIQRDSLLDQQRLLQEREQERLLAESEVRVGQEKELQKKVSAAVTQPVVRLEKKLTSTFNGITKAIQFLFTGFLSGVVINGIKNSAGLSIRALAGIGELFKNSFRVIGSGLSALKGGFGSVIRSITGITGRISEAIISLAASPFKAIADVFKNFLPGMKPSGTGAPPTTTNPPPSGSGGGLWGMLKFAGRLFSGFDAVSSAMQGDIPGAVTSGAVALFPNPITIATSLGYQIYKNYGQNNLLDTSKVLTPELVKYFGSAGQNILNSIGNIGIDLYGTQGTQGTSTSGNSSSSREPTAVQLQTIPWRENQSSINPNPNNPLVSLNLKEPPPNVVYRRIGQPSSQTPIVSSGGQPVTDVPLISASNPDNFLTLNAISTFNLVG